MSHILAIDPATKTGVADTYGLRLLWNLDMLAAHTHQGHRHLALARALRDQLKAKSYGHVAIEEASYGATGQMRVMSFHNSLMGVILLVCAEHGVPVLLAKPTELKKYATGKGNAKKEDMIRAAKMAGERVSDDNIADAYWVMRWAANKVKIERMQCQQ